MGTFNLFCPPNYFFKAFLVVKNCQLKRTPAEKSKLNGPPSPLQVSAMNFNQKVVAIKIS